MLEVLANYKKKLLTSTFIQTQNIKVATRVDFSTTTGALRGLCNEGYRTLGSDQQITRSNHWETCQGGGYVLRGHFPHKVDQLYIKGAYFSSSSPYCWLKGDKWL